MTHPARPAQNTVSELPAEIADLMSVLEQLPVEHRKIIAPVMDRVVANTRRRHRILNLVQDALSQLRLDMKYLMFDLEATRRERDAYRQRLEESAE